MRSKNQVISPKERRAERLFDEFLLFILTLLLISFSSLFVLFGYGIDLLLSEPGSPQVKQNQKSEVGLKIREGQFEATFNEKALYDFTFLDRKTQTKTNLNPQQMPLLQQPRAYTAQLSDPLRSQDIHDLGISKKLLKDFRVELKKDLVIMTIPLTLGETQKTITIREKLKVENKNLVGEIKSVQIGKLTLPGFMTIYVLDSFAPQFINFLAPKIIPKLDEGSEKPDISLDPQEIKLSKMVMPLALLLLFGPRDVLKSIVKERETVWQVLKTIPTLEVNSVKIEEAKITINGRVKGFEQFDLPEDFNPMDILERLRR